MKFEEKNLTKKEKNLNIFEIIGLDSLIKFDK